MSARGSSAVVRARLAQQRARALGVALQQRVLGELAQVVGRHAAALLLHRRAAAREIPSAPWPSRACAS